MRSYLQHGRRHLPEGSDPIPGQVTPADFFTASYVTFERSFAAVAANTTTDFDLSTASVASSNEASGSLAGTSWTGNNFAYTTTDANYLHILTAGVYFYEATLWLGFGSTVSGAFTAAIEETGSTFTIGAPGANRITQTYIDPAFIGGTMNADNNVNAFRHATYAILGGSSFPVQRGLSFSHNNGSAIDIGVTFCVFRIAPAS